MRLDFRQWLEMSAKQAVLVGTGAYNPIHKGHIQVFYHAKRFLSNNDYDVVVGYVIPRNYEYIQKKTAGKEEDAVSDTHRQKMVDMAAQGTFLKVLPLEDMLKHPNMSQQEIRAHIQKMHPSAEIIFVAGDDKAQCQPGEDACLKDDPVWGKYVVVSRGLAGGASSTDVRNHLKKTGDEKNLLRPTVRDYIHQNHLWGARGATV